MLTELIKDRKLKIALVGCGRISENHIAAMQQHHTDIELVAVCDTNPHRLKATMDKHHVPGFSNIDELLTKTDADIVVLSTPSGLHAEQACKVAQAGKHVITEKPMATRWNDGLTMVKACDKAGVYLFVVKQNRCNETIRKVKEAIVEGRFGKIYMVHSNVFWSRPQSYYDQDKWRGTWEFDGGAFMNQASHYVDLLEWLIGPVQSVHAMMGTLARNIEVEDTGVLNIRWRSGVIGSMSVTMLAYPKNFEGSVTVIGEKGIVRIGGIALNEIQHWQFAEAKEGDDRLHGFKYEIPSVYGYGHALYYENIINVFRGKANPQTDGREGLRSLELLVAAYLSAREDKTIHLPLEL